MYMFFKKESLHAYWGTFSTHPLEYRHHTRGMFRPFHNFVSRVLCPYAKSQSKSDCPITSPRTISEVGSSIFFFSLDARAVKRFRGSFAYFILVYVYSNWCQTFRVHFFVIGKVCIFSRKFGCFPHHLKRIPAKTANFLVHMFTIKNLYNYFKVFRINHSL